MGILHKLVFILGKLDRGNQRWKETQLAKLDSAPMREELEAAFAENDDDYGRKLYLIENCLYGVDIQPIAIQISKLRFFISLVCDQKTNRNKKDNHGIRPLPNLETKFVAADTLIRLPEAEQQDLFVNPRVEQIEKEIETLYHSHFGLHRRDQKLATQKKIKDLREELAEILANSLGFMSTAKAKHVAEWNPFDPQSVADFFDPHWMYGRKLKDGFDIVIGNPPYIQIQKFPKKQKDLWVEQGFETYAATADIYCLFYERGAQLLSNRGYLYYITSNKWMRAGYGDKLREFLTHRVDTEVVYDFGMAQNFSAATTYTCIVAFENTPPEQAARCCYVTDDKAAMTDPKPYFEANAVEMKELDSKPWVVVTKERYAIKKAVEDQGIPLEKWDLKINYGIKTGFNDAFYLTQEQRDELIAKEPHAEEIIVPLLRGRFVGRYETNWDGTWMINSHNSVKQKGTPRIDIPGDYPVLYEHLKKWEKALRKRQDKGDHWTNLRNCVYVDEFKKPKIMYPNMTKYLPFYFDEAEDGFIGNQKCFIITSEEESLEYLIAVLNSSLFKYCFKDNFPELLGNTYELSKIFFDKIPIKKPSDSEKQLFEILVHMIQKAKKQNLRVEAAFIEDLIDACVLESYFPEEASAKKLRFIDQTLSLLSGESKDIQEFIQTINAPTHPIRDQLIRLAQESPELFGVIKKEGEV
ncbi:MAG: Eco57I restriction-modification methylase domain-containing protein [Kiritimatiellae bacterium]|nr:Eco57I restriction-modification methylase domain-containing protein [Kiritimatiellia bacterium]